MPFRPRRNISRRAVAAQVVAEGAEADVRQQLVINVCVAPGAARFVPARGANIPPTSAAARRSVRVGRPRRCRWHAQSPFGRLRCDGCVVVRGIGFHSDLRLLWL